MSERILVFAPHPDDEILGCGGLLALAAKEYAVRVIVVTDGARGILPSSGGGAAIRLDESRRGLARLGVPEPVFWRYPDGEVPLSGPILDRYRAAVAEFRPTRILLPAPGEQHADHRAVTRGIVAALEGHWSGELWFYETTQPAGTVNSTLDISPVVEEKLAALAEHASQTAQFDYAGYSRSLAALRGATIGRPAAEAFLAFEWDGTRQRFFENRPLISVIVRADDQKLLRHALASVRAQQYDHVEVVVVWHGAEALDLTAYHSLDVKVVRGGGSRGANLNCGIAQARGDFLAFLDQDDILYAEHLGNLLAELDSDPACDIVYSGCRAVTCRRRDGAIEVGATVQTFDEPYRPGRLLVGNTIPIHAALYRASVFRTVRFDETLGAYEDWELVARLELSGYVFRRVEGVTCEYRLYSDEPVPSLQAYHEARNYPVWRAAVLARIVPLMKPDHLDSIATVVGSLETTRRQLGYELEEAQRRTREADERAARLLQQQALLERTVAAIGTARGGAAGLAELAGRSLADGPLISIVMPVFDTEAEILTQSLFSVVDQAYPRWQLCLVDDASTRAETVRVLDEFRRRFNADERVICTRRSVRGGIVAASNDALALATGDYVAFLDHDDVLDAEALLEIALAVRERPYDLIYTDSRTIDHAGNVLHVYHKPDWSPENLLHLNYINHLTVLRRERIEAAGRLHARFEGLQDWDLLARAGAGLSAADVCHVRRALYDWRATEGSVSYAPESKPWMQPVAHALVADILARRGLSHVEVHDNARGAGFVATWDYAPEPIDVIVPTHNNVAGLASCVKGLTDGTDYPNLTVTIVANRCSEPEMQTLLAELSGARVRVLSDNRPFNWSGLNNRAAGGTAAPWLLFMNDDVEIRSRDWLKRMARYLSLEGVGVVGALLFYPDGSVQHNGIRTDPAWVARNIQQFGARNELAAPHNCSAVTGACMLVRRNLFEQLGGFDERLPVGYNDVDFCLAARSAGFRILQATDVELVHHESATRGGIDNAAKRAQWDEESRFVRAKWGEYLTEHYHAQYDVHVEATRILRLA